MAGGGQASLVVVAPIVENRAIDLLGCQLKITNNWNMHVSG